MKFGVFYFPTDYGIDITELATALEERNLESLFVCEHTHIPASRKSPFPGGGDLPKKYVHTHDPFVALSFAAAATKRLKLGTGICLVPQHDPIVTAKAIASLDMLSGGRFEFGIGGGWNVEEMNNHSVAYKSRFKQMREHTEAMKAIWTEEEASYDGEFVKFESIWSYPKPTTKPHPPILLGGESDYTLRRIVEYCDGWIPRGNNKFEPKSSMARLNDMADKYGRNPAELSVTLFRGPTDKAALDLCREAGVKRVLYEVPDGTREEALRALDDVVALKS
ncbi:MAG: LLM class F420-dependent oxidoreductase [Hyphomicrobiaceae bacterium]